MKKVAIVGMGAMGSAIAKSLKKNYQILPIDRDIGKASDVAKADIVILAVRPKSFVELVEALPECLNDSQLVISIMAGVSLRSLRKGLGVKRVVRTMPNLAVASGQSLTGWYAYKSVDINGLQDILDLWGESLRVDREKQVDSFTALVGSGPAYYFHLAHLLEQQALAHGFNARHARTIATQTFRSAASAVTDDTNLADEVQRVASKGGTTEAALAVFAAHGCGEIVGKAVHAAYSRCQQLDAVY